MSITPKGLSVAVLFSTMLLASPSGAADLASDAVKNLVGEKMWVTENMLNSRQLRSFEWKKDGTVCLRLGSTSGKCDDTGTWRIDGAQVCWEFTWWMKSQDMASACLSATDLGKGRYEAKTVNGTKFMEFTVKS